jgi:hypothetical protein
MWAAIPKDSHDGAIERLKCWALLLEDDELATLMGKGNLPRGKQSVALFMNSRACLLSLPFLLSLSLSLIVFLIFPFFLSFMASHKSKGYATILRPSPSVCYLLRPKKTITRNQYYRSSKS